MSWRVANICAERRFGSPVRKQIIMFLADKASDDGSGIWCSKGTIARHTELGDSTVKRAISEMLAEGLLAETGRRSCANGFTMIYRIVVEAVERLNPVEGPPVIPTRSAADPVQSGPGRGPAADPVPGPQRTPNHPETILKPPPREGALVVEEEVIDRVLSAYPQDRKRDEPTCRRLIAAALVETSADELLAAVQAYAAETSGFTRSKVCYSDNWLREEQWRRYLGAARQREAEADASLDQVLSRAAGWVKARSTMCRHVSPAHAVMAVERGLITRDQAHAAGVMR